MSLCELEPRTGAYPHYNAYVKRVCEDMLSVRCSHARISSLDHRGCKQQLLANIGAKPLELFLEIALIGVDANKGLDAWPLFGYVFS